MLVLTLGLGLELGLVLCVTTVVQKLRLVGAASRQGRWWTNLQRWLSQGFRPLTRTHAMPTFGSEFPDVVTGAYPTTLRSAVLTLLSTVRRADQCWL